jgi:transcription antitermination factor NusA-like protein
VEFGGSPQLWGAKRSVMKRSTVAYDVLKELGFSEVEIASWVKRPKGVVKTVTAPVKIAKTEVKSTPTEPTVAESTRKQVPIEPSPRGSVTQQTRQSSAIIN